MIATRARLQAALSGVFLAVAVLACKGATTPPVIETSAATDSSDQVIFGMDMNLHEGGIRRAHVRADSALFYDRSQRLVMLTVSADFFTSTGVNEGVLTANRANFNRITEEMEAFGNVVLVSADGRRVTSPQMKYDKANNRITGDSAVVATTPDGVLEGTGFETDPSLTAIKILKNARGSAKNVTIPGR